MSFMACPDGYRKKIDLAEARSADWLGEANLLREKAGELETSADAIVLASDNDALDAVYGFFKNGRYAQSSHEERAAFRSMFRDLAEGEHDKIVGIKEKVTHAERSEYFAARKRAGYSQKDIAEQVGLSQRAVSHFENGKTKGSDEMVEFYKDLLSSEEL
ncbi:hypothetical protein CMI48_02430 [Candidatus Pacearchaeota archaeon]|nr:hypothetical protein [Candidatus Pacearchaeota archaeon]|tara:strand:- start:176 stop:655 length:480 start_codon:yes stop_codon:yes gene_type:complete